MCTIKINNNFRYSKQTFGFNKKAAAKMQRLIVLKKRIERLDSWYMTTL
jgi:hypothetical protein